MKWMAAEQPAGGQPAAAPETVLQQGEPGILRAGRSEAAGAGQPRREAPLVKGEEENQPARHARRSRRLPKSLSSSIFKAGKSLLPASGFKWTTKSRAGSWLRSCHRR